MTAIRTPLVDFAVDMEERLRAHDGEYGGNSWPTSNQHHILPFMDERMIRLHDAVTAKDHAAVQNLSADVGNYAMMISDIAKRLAVAETQNAKLTKEN